MQSGYYRYAHMTVAEIESKFKPFVRAYTASKWPSQ